MIDGRAELQKLSLAFGLCIPVADLESPSPRLALQLRLGEYLPFYLLREEDTIARQYLEQYGLLIVGRPLSGKTRMALEAILAVAPKAILLRIGGPDSLLNLDALTIPPMVVDGQSVQPSVALLLDEVSRFEGAQIDRLIDRVAPQVAKLYIVATCRSGSLQRVLGSASFRSLSGGPLSTNRMVEISPLSPLQAQEVEKEVWRLRPGRDLGLDRTEVGVILRGTNTLQPSYDNISADGKRVLRALFLGECITSPCPIEVLRGIVARVTTDAAITLDASLAELVEADIVVRDDLTRLSIASAAHIDRVSAEHYTSIAALKKDLEHAAAVLLEQRDWARVTALAEYHGESLNDLAGARSLLEASLRIEPHPDTLTTLALVLARLGQYKEADATLAEFVRTTAEPNRQANLLLRLGDELLLRHQVSEALRHYRLAGERATAPPTMMAAAFREAFMKAGALLLEPVMAVEVVTPATYVGDCIGDLSRRRGEIRAQHSRGNTVAIEAHVPLKEMFGYIGSLRALSSGRAQYSMQFDHYAPAPLAVAEALTAA